MEQQEVLRRLETAMESIPRKSREIFLAKRLDDLTYAEIANRTGLTVDAIERHMVLAISQIDRHLGQDQSSASHLSGIQRLFQFFFRGKAGCRPSSLGRQPPASNLQAAGRSGRTDVSCMMFFDGLSEAEEGDATRVLKLIFDEFSYLLSTATQQWKKGGRILKVLLWSDASRLAPDPTRSTLPPWHVLVVLNTDRLARIPDHWAPVQERLRSESCIQGRLTRDVHLLVHSLGDVNAELERGTSLFVDIIGSAVTLYDDSSSEFARPKALTEAEIDSLSRKHFRFWFPLAVNAHMLARHSLHQGALRDAAFLFHQAVERSYHCVLLRSTLYSPKTHSLELLRSISERVAPALKSAWPRDNRFEKRCFDRLRRSYVDARYREEFVIRSEELAWIDGRVTELQELVRIESAIRDLAPDLRRVFNARRIEALEYEEIGERFGLKVDQVENDVHRALEAIARALT